MTGRTSPSEDDAATGERAKVTVLVRWLAVFVAVPTITIGLALYAFDPAAHAIHMVAFLILGALAIVALFNAPRLAARFVP